ncbi:MAG: hypothetical protein JWM14_2407 [Chitinophagaceae bacterium]|nr:hypothetical protein [Chitinophagaceae bacterium]
MFASFKRDHFILGYTNNGILYIKNGDVMSFDNLKRLGYDSTKAIDQSNNLFDHARNIKVSIFMPLRKNLWLSPWFTVVSASPLQQEEVTHLYRFCQLMGGIEITISHVSCVKTFLEQPSIKLVRKNYVSC